MNPVRRLIRLQQGNRLIDSILEERDLLENLKERADIVIDTSSLSIHQLVHEIYEAMLRIRSDHGFRAHSVSVSNTVFPSTPTLWPT